MNEKSREQRVRRALRRQGYLLKKLRAAYNGRWGYRIISFNNQLINEWPMNLDEVEAWAR